MEICSDHPEHAHVLTVVIAGFWEISLSLLFGLFS